MLKAANVTLVGRVGIGGAFVTTMVRGDVGSVRARRRGRRRGRQPRRRAGQRPRHPPARRGRPADVHRLSRSRLPSDADRGRMRDTDRTRNYHERQRTGPDRDARPGRPDHAIDAMLKAANVELASSIIKLDGGVVSVMVRGDVSSVRAAVEAGAEAAGAGRRAEGRPRHPPARRRPSSARSPEVIDR